MLASSSDEVKNKVLKSNLKIELEGFITTEDISRYKIDELVDQINFFKYRYLKISTNRFCYLTATINFLGYRLEYRNNTPNVLFVSDIISKSAAIEILECYLFEDCNWQRKIEWKEYDVDFKEGETSNLINKSKLLVFIVIILFLKAFKYDDKIWNSAVKFFGEHNINPLYIISFISIIIVLFNSKRYKHIKRLNSFERMNLYSIFIIAIITLILSILSVFN